MNIAYALTSGGKDFYSAMTRVSIASVRSTNPDFRISLVCDALSEEALRSGRDPLLDETDDVIVYETPPGDAIFRSRFLKTRLRTIVDGPFLFLDSDALVRGSLAEIFGTRADIAGAPNRSKDDIGEQIWSLEQEQIAAMSWPILPHAYFNSGVIFFHDSEAAHRFGEEWHKKWLHSCERGVSYRDQPAFNAALAAVRPRLHVLPHRFNAQFRTEPGVAAEAVVWHYYASAGAEPTTIFELMVQDLLRGAALDRGRVEDMVRSSHPWRQDPLYRVVQAKGLARGLYRRIKSFGARVARA